MKWASEIPDNLSVNSTEGLVSVKALWCEVSISSRVLSGLTCRPCTQCGFTGIEILDF
jgi:hypothetical protein